MNEIHDVLVKAITETKEAFSRDIIITDDTNLVTDLSFNSIDFMQLVVKIEESLDISFDLDEYMDSGDINLFKTVKNYLIDKSSESEGVSSESA